MSKELQQLVSNIRATRKAYERLIELAEKERLYILQNNIPSLRGNLESEERLAEQAAKLNDEIDSRYMACCSALGVRADLPEVSQRLEETDAGRFDALCEHVTAEWAERTQTEWRALRVTFQELLRLNRSNIDMVNESVDSMKGVVDAISADDDSAAH